MQYWAWSRPEDPYLTRLRTEYHLDELVADKPDDYARVQAVTRWVHGLWEHDGEYVPATRDPLTIIEAAKQGQRFRCVEYSIVLAGALCSIGIPARNLALKTADVETRESGAGHLVNEAYLPDRKRWIMVDGQMGVFPERDGEPLSAVEFRQALTEGAPGLTITGDPGVEPEEYIAWVKPYLHFMDVPYDNRVGVPDRSRQALMLVPDGTQPPRVFQGVLPLDYLTYTNAVAEFYPGVHLGTNPTDEEMLGFADAWIDLVAEGRFEAAYRYTAQDPYFGWSPDLIRRVIEGYGVPDSDLDDEPHRVTPRETAAGKPHYRCVDDYRDTLPPFLEIVYDLPVDGAWSDLTVTFRVDRTPCGCTVTLQEIHVF